VFYFYGLFWTHFNIFLETLDKETCEKIVEQYENITKDKSTNINDVNALLKGLIPTMKQASSLTLYFINITSITHITLLT